MSAAPETFGERMRERWEQLSSRERTLLAAWVAIMALGLTSIAVYQATTTLGHLAEGNDDRREAIAMLLAERDDFRARIEQARTEQEKLENNELRLSSFIEAAATRQGIRSPSEYNDRREVRDNGIAAMQTTAVFPSMDMVQLDELLNTFQNTEELVYIEQVAVEPPRGRNTEGLQVEVTLVTYERASAGEMR